MSQCKDTKAKVRFTKKQKFGILTVCILIIAIIICAVTLALV